MKRLFLFLATNLAVLSVLFQVFGVEQWLYREGAGINVQGLLIFSALFGMGGSFISLALSKWLAKSGMGVRVTEQPADAGERWLLQTVERLAREAGGTAEHDRGAPKPAAPA
jgi:heat shock protein HtpX